MQPNLMNTSEDIPMYSIRFLPKTQTYVLFAVDSIEEMVKLGEESIEHWGCKLEVGHTISIDRTMFFKLITKERIKKTACYKGTGNRRGFVVWGLKDDKAQVGS